MKYLNNWKVKETSLTKSLSSKYLMYTLSKEKDPSFIKIVTLVFRNLSSFRTEQKL